METKIYSTKKYERFVLHNLNRKVDREKPKFKKLIKSLAVHGWKDPYPMYVVWNGDGRLRIKDGHHRFEAARLLEIPVKYVIDDDDLSMFEITDSIRPWDMRDFLQSYAQLGKSDYLKVKEYHDRTGIGIMNCIAILGGQTAGSNGKCEAFKQGRFTLGNMSNANAIAEIVSCLKDNGIDFATNSNFVKAISMVVWVKEFKVSEMKKKISVNRALIIRQPTKDAYLDMLQDIYNRQRRREKIPLAFMAKEAAKSRLRAVLGPKKKTRRSG